MPRTKVWFVEGHRGGQVPFLVAIGRARVAVALPKAGCVRQEPACRRAGCRMRRVCVCVCVCGVSTGLPTVCTQY